MLPSLYMPDFYSLLSRTFHLPSLNCSHFTPKPTLFLPVLVTTQAQGTSLRAPSGLLHLVISCKWLVDYAVMPLAQRLPRSGKQRWMAPPAELRGTIREELEGGSGSE